MRKYKLLVADLDGTLLDDTYIIKPELIQAFREMRKKGIRLAVATGRLYPSALPFVRELEVTLPVIASNGAVVKDPCTDQLLYHLPLPKDLALKALFLTEKGTSQRFVNINDVFYTDAPLEATKSYSEALKVQFVRHYPLEEIITEDPTMVVIRDSEEQIAKMTPILKRYLGENAYLANSKPFFIDINHPKVSKGAALLNLCRFLNIDCSDVIAIGDAWNDLEMFKTAGLGVAVANAPDNLKSNAGYVCEKPAYEGVVETIERFILK